MVTAVLDNSLYMSTGLSILHFDYIQLPAACSNVLWFVQSHVLIARMQAVPRGHQLKN